MSSMQYNANLHNDSSSSDQSSFDHTSFCSTFSHHSNGAWEDHIVHNSIFLDDVNTINHHVEGNIETQADANPHDEHTSLIDIDNLDDILNCERDTPLDDSSLEENYATSFTSSLENSSMIDGSPSYGDFPLSSNHCFEEMTLNETASYKIMALLDTAGAPRIK